MPSPLVLLLRAPRASGTRSDPYVGKLSEVGFRARCVPVLRFEYAEKKLLEECLARPEDFDGIILTSPRATHALAGLEIGSWRQKPTFVVGRATAGAAEALGLKPVGAKAGSAAALAEFIVRQETTRSLLFLCGDRRRDVLPDRLRSAGIDVQECVVYRTIGEADDVRTAMGEVPDWVVFFSPSGIEAAIESVGDLADPSWNRVRKAAIGPTTANALRAAGATPDAIASEPTPEALAAALLATRPSDA